MKENVLDVLMYLFETYVDAEEEPESDQNELRDELSRAGPYNRKLFRRMRHGQYLINPRLALRVEGEWRNIYELLEPQRLAARHRDPQHWYGEVYDHNPHLEAGISRLPDMLARMAGISSPDLKTTSVRLQKSVATILRGILRSLNCRAGMCL